MKISDSDLLDFVLITLFRSRNLHMDNTSEFIINDRSAQFPYQGRASNAKEYVKAAYLRAAARYTNAKELSDV